MVTTAAEKTKDKGHRRKTELHDAHCSLAAVERSTYIHEAGHTIIFQIVSQRASVSEESYRADLWEGKSSRTDTLRH